MEEIFYSLETSVINAEYWTRQLTKSWVECVLYARLADEENQ